MYYVPEEEQSEIEEGEIVEDGEFDSGFGGEFEGDGEDGSDVSAQATLPTYYNSAEQTWFSGITIRDQGALNLCWAFSAISAAETSILFTSGLTYEETGLDLSERHLAYFAFEPVTESIDPSQAGEGMYYAGEEKDTVGYFGPGGLFLVANLFPQGAGPAPEEAFPYRGVNESGEPTYIPDLHKYSENDDWSIPEYSEEGYLNRYLTCGFILKDENYLGCYDPGAGYGLPEGYIDLFKQELLNGRAIAAASNMDFCYMASSKEKGLLYAAYCYDDIDINHGICIVGWDDNYDAENFAHTLDGAGDPMTDAEGNPLSEEEALALTTPPGNGAWIVKNSWGSETDCVVDDLGNLIHKSQCGVKDENGKATGYTYLSYYDKSLSEAITYEFSSDLYSEKGLIVCQYDYMPGLNNYAPFGFETPTSCANVFAADEASLLKSVSTLTVNDNTRATFAVYLLNEDTNDPTDGELVYRASKNFEHPGFHRITLDQPVELAAGQRFSVIVTSVEIDEEGVRHYIVPAKQGFSREYGTMYGEDRYTKAVLNRGESYFYTEGEWSDWSEELENTTIPPEAVMPGMSDKYIDYNPTDNFSIKAYLIPAEIETFLQGDVNGDGSVDNKDVVLLFCVLSGDLSDVFVKEAADMNNDGRVNNKDVFYLFRYVSSQTSFS